MTGLLVLGLILLAYGMVRTAGKMSADLGEVAVPVPEGADLVNVSADGGRLYVALRHADGTQEVLVLEAKSGRQVGRYRLTPTP